LVQLFCKFAAVLIVEFVFRRLLSWPLAVPTDCTAVYIVFRHSAVYSISALYVPSICHKPFPFSAPYTKPTDVSCPICTLLVSFCCLHFFSPPINYTNTGTANAPVAVILFLVFISHFSIIMNVPLFSSFISVDVMYSHFPQYSGTCRFFPAQLLYFSADANHYIVASELIVLPSVQSLCTFPVPIPYSLSH
jgi:hypothetical protein